MAMLASDRPAKISSDPITSAELSHRPAQVDLRARGNAVNPPGAVRLSFVVSILHVIPAPLMIVAGIVYALVSPYDEIGVGILAAGIIVFLLPPALLCTTSAIGIRRRRRWGYWTALIVHAAIASVGLLVLVEFFDSLWTQSPPVLPRIDPSDSGFAVATILVMDALVNAAAVVGLTSVGARTWFGLAPLSWRRPASEER